jgi:hypothetical protein
VWFDGSQISSRAYCVRENGVMGSLETRRVAKGDRTSFWKAVVVDLFFWWHRMVGSCRAASLQAGIDARGTRGDFQRRYGSVRSIAKLLGRSPSTVSREMSRNGGCDRYRAACGRECRGIQSQRTLAPAAITTLRGLLRRTVCDSDASILAPGPRRHQSIGRFCMTIRIGRSSVQSTAAYSFKLSNHRPNWNASR